MKKIFFILLIISQSLFAQRMILLNNQSNQTNNKKQISLYLSEKKNPIISGISSIIFPGGGHFYNGNYTKGVTFFSIRLTTFIILRKLDIYMPLQWISVFYFTCFDLIFACNDAIRFNENLIEKYNIGFYFGGNHIGLACHF